MAAREKALNTANQTGGGKMSAEEISAALTVAEQEAKAREKSVGSTDSSASESGDMDLILDIPLDISVELGRTKMLIHDLLKLGQGSVIELTKNAGESLDILANQRLIARGEVVVINEKYGIRLTEVISPMARVEKLQ